MKGNNFPCLNKWTILWLILRLSPPINLTPQPLLLLHRAWYGMYYIYIHIYVLYVLCWEICYGVLVFRGEEASQIDRFIRLCVRVDPPGDSLGNLIKGLGEGPFPKDDADDHEGPAAVTVDELELKGRVGLHSRWRGLAVVGMARDGNLRERRKARNIMRIDGEIYVNVFKFLSFLHFFHFHSFSSLLLSLQVSSPFEWSIFLLNFFFWISSIPCVSTGSGPGSWWTGDWCASGSSLPRARPTSPGTRLSTQGASRTAAKPISHRDEVKKKKKKYKKKRKGSAKNIK